MKVADIKSNESVTVNLSQLMGFKALLLRTLRTPGKNITMHSLLQFIASIKCWHQQYGEKNQILINKS